MRFKIVKRQYGDIDTLTRIMDDKIAKIGISTDSFFDNLDIMKKYSLEDISIALAHYCFRNGPVEDMHADPNSQLSQDDMKVLNKYCADKIFTFLTMMKDNSITKLNEIIKHGVACGIDWDSPEYREKD